MTTPAGWYPDPDPAAQGRERQWDGQKWTDQTRPVPTQPSPGMPGGQHTPWADVRDGSRPAEPADRPGGPLPLTPKKKSLKMPLLIGGLIVFVLFGLFAINIARGADDKREPGVTADSVDTTEAGTTEAGPETTEAETTSTEPFVEDGTRDKPLAVGDESSVGDWGVKVVEIKPDAGADIEAINDFNDPPSNGRYMLVRIEATYNGDKEDTPDGSLVVALSGSDGVQYKDFECGAVVNNDSVPELEPGGKATFATCLNVKPEAITGGVVFVEELVSFDHEERVYWKIP